uniref:Uncharacterized protein n=1 Tax=Cucumis melo TaxID=3656 RepID=A0A9I9EA38_CUCME
MATRLICHLQAKNARPLDGSPRSHKHGVSGVKGIIV